MLKVNHLTGFGSRSANNLPAGLSIWARYKASTMASVGDGNTLSQWDDISGNARHATQATSARRPVYRATASGLVGNTSAVEFLGNSSDPHYVSLPNMSALTQGAIFVYHKNDTDTQEATTTVNTRRIWILGTSTDEYYKYTNNAVGSGIYENFGTSVRKTTGNPSAGALSVWHSYAVTSASASFLTYINNVQHFTTGTNTVAFPAAPTIGGNPIQPTPPPNLSNKLVAEIIICSVVPSATERAAIQAYFLKEYA
jgi:hypothetical protein